MDTDNFLKSSFFKNLKTDLDRCWEPTETCNSVPIKAHSIQNSRVLDLISHNGHVIMPKERIEQKGKAFALNFGEVGRNDASTFNGLCEKHDKELFSPIDDLEIELNNYQQLFLLAYRSVLKKLYSLSLAAVKIQKIYDDQVKAGRATQNTNDPSLNITMIQFIRAYGAYVYKRQLDQAYINKEYDLLNHDAFSFRHKRPTIAVSAFYWLEIQKQNNGQVPWIVLNVFPKTNETCVVYSYIKEDAQYVKVETRNILNSSIKRKLQWLSKSIIESTENFALSPSFWDSLSKQKRQTIISFYRDTLIEKKPFDGDIRDLCLFEISYKNDDHLLP